MDSRPIQVVAPGMLGYLQLKANGQNPDVLTDRIQATLELREWLLTAGREFYSWGTPLAAPGTATRFQPMTVPNALTVPPGEVWYIWQATGYIPMTPADTYNGPLGITYTQNITTGPIPFLAADNYQAFTAALPGSFLVTRAEPRRWFLPGTEFGLALSQLATAAGTTGEIHLEFTRAKL